MVLAQTGTYQGEPNIEEYVKFLFAGYSPYISCCNDFIKREVNFVGYDNGQCQFVNLLTRNVQFIPNATDAPTVPIQVAAGLKLYLDFERRYISQINVFYTDDYLRVFFDTFLNSNNTRRFICSVMDGPCASILNTTANFEISSNKTCPDNLLALPTVTGLNYVDGKSRGCRALHAAFANSNPTQHCPHLSFAPLQDPSGNVKCQTSKNILPSTLFTVRELEMYAKFAKSVGLDPVKGHNYME
jgi:hypothetical protein